MTRRLRWLLLATHVAPSGSGGGMVRYVVELARSLAARPDVELHVVCGDATTPFFTELVGDPARVHAATERLPVPLRSALEREGLGLPVLREPFDVLQGAKHLLPRRHRAATTLLTVHDMLPLDRPGDFGAVKRALLRGPYLASLEQADALVCVSAATRDRLRGYAPEAAARAAVVHLAPSRSLIAAVAEPVPQLASRPFALVVGDPSPRKNLAHVMGLWPAVVAQRPDALLVVVGPPSWGPADLGPAGSLVRDGHVLLLGHLSDAALRWAYEHASVVLCPSLLEGFGLPSVEGAAFGAPVITSDDPALCEVSASSAQHLSLHDRAGWLAAVVAALDGRAPVAPRPTRTWDDVADETVAVVRRAG